MPIILRLDIDKPYGRATLRNKVMSKLAEDYYFPASRTLGYLSDLEEFLNYLNSHKIPAISYHRLCTAPDVKIVNLLKAGGHHFGLHAENTRSLDTLREEVGKMRAMVPDLKIHSFTKHGSGELKLGRYHYAPYEPEKYLVWSREIGLPFHFGNGVALAPSAFAGRDEYYPDMYWIDPGYQKSGLTSVENAIAIAADFPLVAIVHPENLRAIPSVRQNFEQLVKMAGEREIEFTSDVSAGSKPR